VYIDDCDGACVDGFNDLATSQLEKREVIGSGHRISE
jgi:hypothetical protein